MSDPASNPNSPGKPPAAAGSCKGGAALGAALAAWVGRSRVGRSRCPMIPRRSSAAPSGHTMSARVRAGRKGEASRVEDGRAGPPHAPGRRWGSSRRRRSTSWSTAAVFPTSTPRSTVS